MKTFGRTLAIGMATGLIALAGAQEVRAASIITTLEGKLGLGINATQDPTMPFPYAVYTRALNDPDFRPYFALDPLPPTSQLPGRGVNGFGILTNPLLDPTKPSAPGWRLTTEFSGTLYFTDRFTPPSGDPDDWTGTSQPFSTVFSVEYGAGLSANDLLTNPLNAVDFYSAFWQATLFQVNQVDPAGPSGVLGFPAFSRIAQLDNSVLPMVAADTLQWQFDVLLRDLSSPVETSAGEFEFALRGPNGIDSLNTLWAAAGFGPNPSFFSNQGNAVPTGITYTMTMTLTAIPVPAALPLMLGALGVLGFAGWKRRRALAA